MRARRGARWLRGHEDEDGGAARTPRPTRERSARRERRPRRVPAARRPGRPSGTHDPTPRGLAANAVVPFPASRRAPPSRPPTPPVAPCTPGCVSRAAAAAETEASARPRRAPPAAQSRGGDGGPAAWRGSAVTWGSGTAGASPFHHVREMQGAGLMPASP